MIRHLIEDLGAMIALLGFVIAAKAFLDLRRMDKEKRERKRQLDQPEPMRRAG